MNPRLPLTAALLALTLTLGACGGGAPMPDDGAPRQTAPPPSSPLSDSHDPRVARLGALVERSDALLLSGLHMRWSVAGGGETIEDSLVDTMSCAGARCVAYDGAETTVEDLLDPSADIDPDTGEAHLGVRGGFDTATTSGTFEASQTPPDLGVTVSPAVTGYGFWAEHGFAALVLGGGPASVGVDGTTLSGDFSLAQAWVAGDATGTNPAGAGRATWTGIAEAAAVGTEAAAAGTFERLQGTATVTIADLSRPRVGVAIDVPGHDIGAPGWADMALEDGRFATGTSGVDSLAGHFHGPAHEEVWGVFDTAGHVGAFGAKRTP